MAYKWDKDKEEFVRIGEKKKAGRPAKAETANAENDADKANETGDKK